MAARCMKYDGGSVNLATNGFPPRKKFTSKSKDAGLCELGYTGSFSSQGFCVQLVASVNFSSFMKCNTANRN